MRLHSRTCTALAFTCIQVHAQAATHSDAYSRPRDVFGDEPGEHIATYVCRSGGRAFVAPACDKRSWSADLPFSKSLWPLADGALGAVAPPLSRLATRRTHHPEGTRDESGLLAYTIRCRPTAPPTRSVPRYSTFNRRAVPN